MQGGEFERRIATDDPENLRETVRTVVTLPVHWPSTTQSIKGLVMGGFSRTWRYLGEKFSKWKKGQESQKAKENADKSE